MFVGFTPSLPGAAEPFLDSKFAKLFRLGAINRGRPDDRAFILEGRSIIEGFNRLGYQTIGSGAVRWFDPQTPTGGQLIQDFSEFYYSDEMCIRDRSCGGFSNTPVWLASSV